MGERYIETIDGWLDTTTGLEWERDTRPQQQWPTEHDLGDGWRVPSEEELCSVVDRTRSNPATELPGMQPKSHWSASDYVLTTDGAWIVLFYCGSVDANLKTNLCYLRAVRGPNDPRTCRKDAPQTESAPVAGGEQKCGTCQWYIKEPEKFSRCSYQLPPLPSYVVAQVGAVWAHEGANCPTYKRREEPLPVCRLCGALPKYQRATDVTCTTENCRIAACWWPEAEWRKLHGGER